MTVLPSSVAPQLVLPSTVSPGCSLPSSIMQCGVCRHHCMRSSSAATCGQVRMVKASSW